MRITHEADYAIRIVHVLAGRESVMSARDIAEESGVTQRFTLKILRKLLCDGIVSAQKGANGGYQILMPQNELSLGRVIECIDGPLELTHCLSDEFDCTRVGDKDLCRYHKIMAQISVNLRDELYSIKFDLS